jgi:hypothetical protein
MQEKLAVILVATLLHIQITQLDKCRTYLSLVASVATPAQLVQMSQVGHKGVVNTVGSCYLNDNITEALETSHLLSLKGGNGSTEVKHLLTP